MLRGHEGGPLIIGDVMYVHGPFPNQVYALDLKNGGKIIWKYEPKQDTNVIAIMCCDTVNRGVAYADGKIILNQADTTLVALDAKDGKVVWQMKNGDPSKGETGTSAPMVVKDKILIGISGGEFGVHCHVTSRRRSARSRRSAASSPATARSGSSTRARARSSTSRSSSRSRTCASSGRRTSSRSRS